MVIVKGLRRLAGESHQTDLNRQARQQDENERGYPPLREGGDGRRLTFVLDGSPEDGVIKDEETQSTWGILGQAVDGPLAGAQLERVVHQDHFWFAWAAFKPDTAIYRGQQMRLLNTDATR